MSSWDNLYLSQANSLDEIMNTIESRYSGEGNGISIKSPVPGSHCIAVFPNDGAYYRARVSFDKQESLQYLTLCSPLADLVQQPP